MKQSVHLMIKKLIKKELINASKSTTMQNAELQLLIMLKASGSEKPTDSLISLRERIKAKFANRYGFYIRTQYSKKNRKQYFLLIKNSQALFEQYFDNPSKAIEIFLIHQRVSLKTNEKIRKKLEKKLLKDCDNSVCKNIFYTVLLNMQDIEVDFQVTWYKELSKIKAFTPYL